MKLVSHHSYKDDDHGAKVPVAKPEIMFWRNEQFRPLIKRLEHIFGFYLRNPALFIKVSRTYMASLKCTLNL